MSLYLLSCHVSLSLVRTNPHQVPGDTCPLSITYRKWQWLHFLLMLKHFIIQQIHKYIIRRLLLFIQQAVRRFYIFLRPFDNYIIFLLQLPLPFQSSSINPFSSISPLISSAQVSLGLPCFLLPGGLHFITFFGSLPSSIR